MPIRVNVIQAPILFAIPNALPVPTYDIETELPSASASSPPSYESVVGNKRENLDDHKELPTYDACEEAGLKKKK